MTIRLTCDDEVRRSGPGGWAADRLSTVLTDRGLRVADGLSMPGDDVHIAVGLPGGAAAATVAHVPEEAESYVITHTDGRTGPSLTVVGSDERGLVYGVLELADVVEHAPDVLSALRAVREGSHSPATPVRGVLRTLTSDVQDMSWYHDRAFWEDYLTQLATHRINRFQLALGMQYNYSHDPGAEDNYLAFAYPFLVDVAGFDVQVSGVDDTERQRNLATLQYISSAAARRGIHFQLGLWNHAYDFQESPRQRYLISGLDASNHAEYCRAALRELLTRCPDIAGITIRVHYEGGIHEPTHEFWETVFRGVTDVGRPVEIDMHSKGADSKILAAARATGSPFVVSAKYWAEHLGLPYHQAAVREMEGALPPREGLSGVTRSVRRFTRYGYGDFLSEQRDYGFLFRIWPGTQRVLLWADPEQVAGIARATAQVGGRGVELCEPLSFLGRKTTGSIGARQIYADPELRTEGDPWSKYAYTYRLWGRLLYDPEADPITWRRYLDATHGDAGADLEAALRASSRILPLVTTYHGPSASNNFYWPELYVNMPLANQGKSDIYAFDTPEPHTVGAVSAFDPELFRTIDEYADELVSGRASGRYTPLDVAGWLEDLVGRAEGHLSAATSRSIISPQSRRVALDVAVLARLGSFFAAKFRASLAYVLYLRTSSTDHLREAAEHYRKGREAFAAVVDLTASAYVSDLAFGDRASERGHWADRLPAIEEDVADLEAELASAIANESCGGIAVLPPAVGSRPELSLTVPETFARGSRVTLEVTLAGDIDSTVELHYRQLNQAEQWRTLPMAAFGRRRQAEILESYTDSPYSLQVYFTVHGPTGDAWIVPGFERSLTNVPYLVLKQSGAGTQ